MTSRSRLALVTVAASFALLAVPPIASANPGTGPDLVRRSGQFVILHADGRDGTSTRQPMLVNGLDQMRVRAPDDVWIEPGSRVRLEGTLQNGALVLGDTVTAVTELAPARLSGGLSQASSIETTAVVQFYLSDQTSSGLPADANATMTTDPKSLKAYYFEQTYEQVTFQTTVFAPVQLTQPKPTTSCTSFIDDWAEEAEALNPTLVESQYKHIVYVFPALSQSVCGWSGIAEVGYRHVWINGEFTVAVLAHELGHNLGIYHAGGLSCTSGGAPATIGAPVGDACSIDRTHYALPQYADPFDAMGNAPLLRQMNMQHKLALGLLPATAVVTPAASGTYRLAPMETLTGTPQVLRLPKAGGGNYFVEYRQPIGAFDSAAGSPAASGVLVHTESPDITDFFSDSDTALVDMHPDGTFNAGQWSNAAMSVGQVFDDPLHGIVIQNLGQDITGVTLAITLPLDTTPPGQPGRLSAVAAGGTVALQWTAATDDRSVASYVVARDGAQIGTTAAVAFADSPPAPGATVVYTVTAVDAAGNVGAPASASVEFPDTAAPSAPSNVTATLTKAGQVRISWGAATDNRGVTSYRVLRNGTGIVQADVKSYVDKSPRPGNGATVTYSVVAFDLVGNAGPPGSAKPLRAALLRKLGASHLKVVRVKSGKRKFVRVKGTVSDVQARCRLRIGKAKWRDCKAKSNGAFSVDLPPKGATPVTLSLRDSLGRVKLLTLRVR